MNEKSKNTQPEPVNRELEIALVQIARSLLEYTKSQDSVEELGRLDPIFTAFERIANNYHNRTGDLHPDLGLELTEWATFKSELHDPNHSKRLAEGKSGLTPQFVDDYGKTPEKIIDMLERDLGIK